MNQLPLLVVALVACGSKKQPDKIEDKPKPPTADAGKAAPSTAEGRIELFDACWGKSDATVLATCYADNAIVESPGAGFPPTTNKAAIIEAAVGLKKQFPDLEISPNVVLGNGKQLAAIVKLAGKPMGVVGAVVVDFDDQGKIAHESDFFDSQTIRYQMKPDPAHPVRSPDAMPALAYIRLANHHTPDDTANEAVVTKFVEAFNKHDLTAAGALLDDHATWSDPTEQKDWTKPELLADREVGLKAFPDLQISHAEHLGCGHLRRRTGRAHRHERRADARYRGADEEEDLDPVRHDLRAVRRQDPPRLRVSTKLGARHAARAQVSASLTVTSS